jgi:hypothetical protein
MLSKKDILRRLISVVETVFVSCEAQTEFLCIILRNSVFKGIIAFRLTAICEPIV